MVSDRSKASPTLLRNPLSAVSASDHRWGVLRGGRGYIHRWRNGISGISYHTYHHADIRRSRTFVDSAVVDWVEFTGLLQNRQLAVEVYSSTQQFTLFAELPEVRISLQAKTIY